MACKGCSVGGGCGSTGGCGSGGCATGGCNRLNAFDWLSQLDIVDTDPFDFVEVSFKNGAHKAFFRVQPHYRPHSGDMVVVDTGSGHDVGRVNLCGELVRLQMKKRRTSPDHVLHDVIRRANERDLERLQEARELERPTMIRARAICHTLGLDMKIGDVEFQGDKRKATFYYTANGRVDFRELIRHFAKEFRVKIEMRQIGARQESARIGGLGSCGRELCCSTWLTDFKSVSTSAARYQNLAINQAKLSGQCGRLKCCLNYELDTYMEAIEMFPEKADRLQTEAGGVVLVKTDVFKQLMFYTYQDGPSRGKLFPLTIVQVAEIQEMNKRGEKPVELSELVAAQAADTSDEPGYEDVTGFIELPPEERRKRSKKKKKKRPDTRGGGEGDAARKPAGDTTTRKEERREPNKSHPLKHDARIKAHRPRPDEADGRPKPQPRREGPPPAPREGAAPPPATGEKGPEAVGRNDNRNNNRRRGNRRNRGKSGGGDRSGGGGGEQG